jgi:hypothetical protein
MKLANPKSKNIAKAAIFNFTFALLDKKTIKRASADVGLIFTCYNLRRIMNLVDKNQLKKSLRELASCLLVLTSYFKPLRRIFFSRTHPSFIFHNTIQVA